MQDYKTTDRILNTRLPRGVHTSPPGIRTVFAVCFRRGSARPRRARQAQGGAMADHDRPRQADILPL